MNPPAHHELIGWFFQRSDWFQISVIPGDRGWDLALRINRTDLDRCR